jgi:S-adenosylmethionine:tRNA ribosyltransferase-isomerase
MRPPAFELPQTNEARRPPEARGLSRDGVSLLVSDAAANTHELAPFTAFASFLRPGDLLVVNDSATIPAAIEARRRNGSTIALHFSTRLSAQMWLVEPRRTPLIAVGECLTLPGGGSAKLVAPFNARHRRLWYALLDLPAQPNAYLHAYAHPIAYDYIDGRYPIETYQTIFARTPGSVEMPSAGRPFTLRVLDSLYRRAVNLAAITLHCGVASPEAHEPPLDERFEVPEWTARAVNKTRAAGNRVIAVGTTVVRALETATGKSGTVSAASGWTSHIVDDSHPPRSVDALLTGFHEPQASHLLMLEAFASHDFLSQAYDAALNANLLWHEFGDVHLILA